MASRLPAILDGLVAPALGRAFPACSLSAWHRGREVLRRAWGEVCGRPASPDHLYDLASLTKLYAATALLKQVSQGRLDLDDKVAKWLPEFAEGGPRPCDAGSNPHTLEPVAPDPRWSGRRVDPGTVTLRDLLTHTSGLHDWLPLFLAPGMPAPDARRKVDRGAGARLALARICSAGFRHPPGREPLYSDLGMILLGEVVARRAQAGLGETIASEVLQPLSLRRTGFNPVEGAWADLDDTVPTEWDRRWRARRVRGEVHDENASAMGGVAGHAGLFAPASEVAAFGQAWLAGGAAWGIPAALWRDATREHVRHAGRRRGLGFMLKATEEASCGDAFGEDSFGHTGFTGTSLWIDPARELVVAFLTNAVHGGRDMSSLQPVRRALHDAVCLELCA